MKIEVGEYVRTEEGYIARVNKPSKRYYWFNDTVMKNSDIPVYSIDTDTEIFTIKKHSKNIIDLIEDEDFVVLEYKSPKYRERISRKFEISKIDNYISFKNQHCSFSCKVGDKKIIDDICKNIKIKSIVTHEQFASIEYKLEEDK